MSWESALRLSSSPSARSGFIILPDERLERPL
jgi:hypothetical protein